MEEEGGMGRGQGWEGWEDGYVVPDVLSCPADPLWQFCL